MSVLPRVTLFIPARSIVHNALRMDRITLLLVRNVAVADMVISVLFYLPALVNLLYGRLVLQSQDTHIVSPK